MSEATLIELGERALAAAFEALEGAAGPGAVTADPDSVVADADPFADVELPSVVVEVPFDDGAGGTFLLVLTSPGALRLGAVIGAVDEEAAEYGGATLGETELAAIAQVGDRIVSLVPDDRFDAGRARARIAEVDPELRRALTPGTRTVFAKLTLLGEPVRVVNVVPSGALLRMEHVDAGSVGASGSETTLSGALHDIDVRVWAELGRTRMPTGEVVGMPRGAIVELDREAEDAVDLYVDGQLYATGRLVVCEDESWGVRIERVLGLQS